MTPEKNLEEGFTDHSNQNYPGSKVCLMCIFGEDTPGTLIFNYNTQANVEGAVGGSYIGIFHCGISESEVSVSSDVNLVSSHQTAVKMDVDGKVNEEEDGLSVRSNIHKAQGDGDQSTDQQVLYVMVESPYSELPGCNFRLTFL